MANGAFYRPTLHGMHVSNSHGLSLLYTRKTDFWCCNFELSDKGACYRDLYTVSMKLTSLIVTKSMLFRVLMCCCPSLDQVLSNDMDIIRKENSTGKMYASGFDKQGRPILVMRPRNENTLDMDGNIKHLVYQVWVRYHMRAHRTGCFFSYRQYCCCNKKFSGAGSS